MTLYYIFIESLHHSAFERPIIMPPSVTANNSVTLSWAQPEGTLPIENYTISLERGTNQPFCSDEIDSRQMTTNDQSVVFSDLYGNSSYNVTVTATAFGTSMMTSQQFMTPASRKFIMYFTNVVIIFGLKACTSTEVNSLPIINLPPPL